MKLHLTIDTEADEHIQTVQPIVEYDDQRAALLSANYMTAVFAPHLPRPESGSSLQLARCYQRAGSKNDIKPGRILSWKL